MKNFENAQATPYNKAKVILATLPFVAAIIVFILIVTKSLPSLAGTQ